MKTKLKISKIFAKLFIAAIFCIFLFACGEETPDSPSDDLNKDKIDIDMEGYICKILQHGFTETGDEDVFYYKKDTLLYDIMLKRIDDINNKFNCEIVYEFYKLTYDFPQYLINNLASWSYVGEISSTIELSMTYRVIAGGSLLPLTEVKDIIDYENFEKYGSPGQLESAMLDGIPYAVTGAMLPLKQSSGCIPISVFNVDLAQKYTLADPREYNDKKNWTWDTFEIFLKDYAVNDGTVDIKAAEFEKRIFIRGAMSSNAANYVVKNGDKYVSGIDSQNTILALDWSKKVLDTYADQIRTDVSWKIMNEELANENTMLIFTQFGEIRDNISYNIDNFGIMPFPCGPLGDYGKNPTNSNMESIGILTTADEKEYAAHIISNMLEPFEEYKDRAAIIEYYKTMFHDERDIEVYLDHDKYARHNYYPVGGSSFADNAALNINNMSTIEIIQKFAPPFEEVVMEYMVPNYEFLEAYLN